MSDRIAVMYLGAIVEEGPTERLVSAAGHPYTRLLISAVPEYRSGARRARVEARGEAMSESRIPSGCRFRTRCPMAQAICREVVPPRQRLAQGHVADCHFAPRVSQSGLAPA
jgi:oligopeptide/dipeptide ABC transporter ATP-binding protein